MKVIQAFGKHMTWRQKTEATRHVFCLLTLKLAMN